MTEVEDQRISKLDRLRQKFFLGNHGLGGDIPCSPERLEFVDAWHWVSSVLRGWTWPIHSRR